MANRNFRRDVATLTPGIVLIAGNVTLTPNHSTGTLSQTMVGASGSMVSAGLYRVRFDDKYVSMLAHSVELATTGSQDNRCAMSGSLNIDSTGQYVDFRIFSGSAQVKPSTVGDRLDFTFVLKNSSV